MGAFYESVATRAPRERVLEVVGRAYAAALVTPTRHGWTVAAPDADGRLDDHVTPVALALSEHGTVVCTTVHDDDDLLLQVFEAGALVALGVPGLRVLAVATAGVDPNRPGTGIVPAARAALHRAGVALDDLDAVELNEAFAGQVLTCCDELGLAATRVCPDGGALALGHPWGASGAVLVVRLFTRLVREGHGTLGLAGIAAGGGQGVALVVERC